MPWVVASFAVALVLDSISLGNTFQPFNPPWTLLVLIYWCWIIPARVGPFTGFCVGLLLDTLGAGVLGLRALGCALVGLLANRLRPLFNSSSIGQQVVIVWGLVLVNKAVVGWLQTLFSSQELGLEYWISSLVAVPVWPLVYTLLKELTPVRRQA
ncbi:MAG: rod shape-determining protein MreD [Arenicellales bacterium]